MTNSIDLDDCARGQPDTALNISILADPHHFPNAMSHCEDPNWLRKMGIHYINGDE